MNTRERSIRQAVLRVLKAWGDDPMVEEQLFTEVKGAIRDLGPVEFNDALDYLAPKKYVQSIPDATDERVTLWGITDRGLLLLNRA
jgi:hypothetical protein